MKKIIILFALSLVCNLFIYGQEYTILYNGSHFNGFINIKKENDSRIVITPSLRSSNSGNFSLPLIEIYTLKPSFLYISDITTDLIINDYFFLQGYKEITNSTLNIVIDRNSITKTYTDGSWVKCVVESNSITKTSSNGSSEMRVVNIINNVTTITNSEEAANSNNRRVSIERIVTTENTTVHTWSDGWRDATWESITTDSNNIKVTWSSGAWININLDEYTETITASSNRSAKRIIEKNVVTISTPDGIYKRTVDENLILVDFEDKLIQRVEIQNNFIFVTMYPYSWGAFYIMLHHFDNPLRIWKNLPRWEF